MDSYDPYERRDDEEFENFVERAFHHLNERLDTMADGIAGLEADEETLAVVIPEIATELGTLHGGLATAEATAAAAVTAAQAAEATAAADSAELATAKTELAKAEGELAAIQTVKTALDPLVAKAQALVPAPVA